MDTGPLLNFLVVALAHSGEPTTKEPRVSIGSAGGDEWTRHVARCPEHAEGQRRRIENEQSSERDGERG